MKNLIKKLKTKLTIMSGTIVSTFIMLSNKVYAEGSNTSSIDSFVTFACDWLTKIGGIIALVGGVMFALGWQREDAERKITWTNDFNGWFYACCYCSI